MKQFSDEIEDRREKTIVHKLYQSVDASLRKGHNIWI